MKRIKCDKIIGHPYARHAYHQPFTATTFYGFYDYLFVIVTLILNMRTDTHPVKY